MAIERYNSKTDAVVKLVLFGFVCLLSFSIGTFVGKKFSDNQHRLAKYEPTETESRGLASVSSHETNKGKAASMTDEEIAKLAEEFVSDDEASSTAEIKSEVAAHDASAHADAKQVSKPEAKEVAEKKVDVKPTEQPLKVAKDIVADKKVAPPAVDAGKARIPSSLPRNLASSPIGKYTVQVGAYPTEEEATKQTERLKKEGHSAFFVEAKVKSGEATKTWYRVSVGLFATKKEAEVLMKDLMTEKKVSTALVQQITK